MADCASMSKDEAAEFESIFSPDDTDLVTDTSKLSLTVETNTSFTNKDLISVLNRVSFSKIKPSEPGNLKLLSR
jgi:succinate dehydrogenase flavin-adding protein (antitoxin of CptAB toxin-antitoxin module)